MERQKLCKWCGAEFTTSTGADYCGADCRKAMTKQRSKYEYKKNAKPDERFLVVRECINCGKVFRAGKAAKWCPECKTGAHTRETAPAVRRGLTLKEMGKLMRLSGMLYPELQRMETNEPEAFEALRERCGV